MRTGTCMEEGSEGLQERPHRETGRSFGMKGKDAELHGREARDACKGVLSFQSCSNMGTINCMA